MVPLSLDSSLQMQKLHRFDLQSLPKPSAHYLLSKHLCQHVAAFLTVSDILQPDLDMVPVIRGHGLCLFHLPEREISQSQLYFTKIMTSVYVGLLTSLHFNCGSLNFRETHYYYSVQVKFSHFFLLSSVNRKTGSISYRNVTPVFTFFFD